VSDIADSRDAYASKNPVQLRQATILGKLIFFFFFSSAAVTKIPECILVSVITQGPEQAGGTLQDMKIAEGEIQTLDR
jgi:hypothetical protein